MLTPLAAFFETQGLLPQGLCLNWRPFIVWLHLGSDAVIAVAYYSIPFALITFATRRRDLVFSGMVYMFSAFIFLCGTTHLMEVWTLWHPDYAVSGLVKAATAAVSLITAVAVWPLLPRALALPSPASLGRVNAELQKEIVFRTAAEANIRSLNLELEQRVETRTAELAAVNDRLRESEERYRRVVDLIAEGIWIHADDKILFANERAARMLAHPSAASLIGSSPAGLIAPESRDLVVSHDKLLMTENAIIPTAEVTLLRADGARLTAEMQAVPFVEGSRRAVMTAVRDISERKLNEELRLLLAREVDHRARNALAVAQSLVKLTKAPTMEAYIHAVEGRIRALSQAHSLLSQNRWQGGDMRQIITDALAVYSQPEQIGMTGAPVTLLAHAVQPVSLVIHELATNAFKHGALQAEAGRVEIGWQVAVDGTLAIDWVESGGPPVEPPASSGFGSTLLNEIITQQLESRFSLDWHPDGLRAALALAPSTFRAERDRAASIGQAGPASTERSVLIVEDDSLIAMDLAATLAERGWEVVGPAISVEQGLKLVQDQAALSLAILDMNLAGRSVYPLAEALEARGIPFLFCTGYEALKASGRFAGVPVLRKPINSAVLDHALTALLASRSAP